MELLGVLLNYSSLLTLTALSINLRNARFCILMVTYTTTNSIILNDNHSKINLLLVFLEIMMQKVAMII
jgi:hypothetical protein